MAGALTVGRASSATLVTVSPSSMVYNSEQTAVFTVTVTPASDKLIWGWIGGFNNETFVAWGTLVRK